MSTNHLEEQKAAAAATNNHEDDDEDSENDEDFVPDEEMDVDDDEGDAMGESEIPTSHLSATKRKAVDEAFERLFGYPFGTSFRNKKRRTSTATQPTVSSKRESLLQQVFGPSVAAQLIATSNSVRDYETKHVELPLGVVEQTVTEVKRFAGRNIVVEKKVTVHGNDATTESGDSKLPASNTTNAAAAAATTTEKQPTPPPPPPPPAAKGGLDSVLAEIAGPSKLSTVAKTSADWDSYKTKAGVEEELEKQAQSNKAYLVKQDFLKRVDERRFEHERAQRDQERAARNMN